MAGCLILLVMALIGKLIYRRESMGMGDFKLVIVSGFFLGPMWNIIALIFGICIGGAWGVVQLAAGKKEGQSEIPFAPFIAAGCFLVLFFRKTIFILIDRYLPFVF